MIIKKFILPYLLTLILIPKANSQDIVPVWTGIMDGGMPAPAMKAMATDNDGNAYYVGNTAGSTSYNYNPFGGVSIYYPQGGLDVFIVKISKEGSFVWGKYFGGTGEDLVDDIVVDNTGVLYLTGSFENTVDFDPGPGEDFYSSISAYENHYILKLDTAGNYIWNKTFEGQWAQTNKSMDVDPNHNILITGHFYSPTLDFDPSNNTFNLPYTSGADLFVVKLNENGELLWGKSIGGNIHQLPADIVCDSSSNIYIAGNFMDTVDFDPDINEVIHISKGDRDAFVLKLDETGSFQWVHTISGVSSQYAFTLDIDPSANVYVAGEFKDTVDFGNENGSIIETTFSTGNRDMFIQCLDTDGNPIWLKSVSGGAYEGAEQILTDENGNSFIGGYLVGTTDFDPGVGVFELGTSTSNGGAFISKYDAQGNFEWAGLADGIYYQRCAGIGIHADESVYFTGNYNGYVDLSLGDGTLIYGTGSTTERPFLAKYHQCTLSESTETISTCDTYTWPVTGLSYNSTNIYSTNLTDMYGCDSIVYLDLTVSPLNLSVLQNGPMLSAQMNGATYQWIDCATNSPINGETNQTLDTPGDGDYAVIINNGICSDTSECTNINSVGINSASQTHFSIRPNPSNGQVTIQSSNTINLIVVMNALGQEVQSYATINSKEKQLELPAQKGVYFIAITSNNQTKTIKVINQ